MTKKLTRNAVKKLVAGGRWANMLLTTPMISLLASWLPAGGAVELVKFGCAPDSNLTKHCEMENMRAVRYTLENGYDFDRALTEAKAKADIERIRPKRGWASTLCTTFSSLQNLNKAIWEKMPDGENRRRDFERRRQRARQRNGRVARCLLHILDQDQTADVYWEWPKDCDGWNTRERQDFKKGIEKRGRQVFDPIVLGCMVGVVDEEGIPQPKPWRIWTTSERFAKEMTIHCDGKRLHSPTMGKKRAHNSAFYPPTMCRRAVKIWQRENVAASDWRQTAAILDRAGPGDEAEALALMRIPNATAEKPGVEELTRMREELRKLHQRGGHSSRNNMKDLLRRRGAPKWLVELVDDVRCSACEEVDRRPGPIPASLATPPRIWQVVGLDVFEMADKMGRSSVQIHLVMASKLASAACLGTVELRAKFQPKSSHLIQGLTEAWLQHYPRPMWICCDPATNYTSVEFGDWCGQEGFGLFVTPGAAHYALGAVERMIQTIKTVAAKMLVDFPTATLWQCVLSAVAAHNNQCRTSGYSPCQWAFCAASAERQDGPIGRLTAEGCSLTELMRVEAEKSYLEAKARERISKAFNTVQRRLHKPVPGKLVYFWRKWLGTRGKADVHGKWRGPARIVMVEPRLDYATLNEHAERDDPNEPPAVTVVWVIHGTRLLRCHPAQLRDASPREEAQAFKDGMVPVTMPADMDELLRNASRGGEYTDISGERPSEEELQRAEAEGERLAEEVLRTPPGDAWRPVSEEVAPTGMEVENATGETRVARASGSASSAAIRRPPPQLEEDLARLGQLPPPPETEAGWHRRL